MADFTIVNVTDLEKATSIEGVTLPFVSADGTKLVTASVEDFTKAANDEALKQVVAAVTDMTTKTDAAVSKATTAATKADTATAKATSATDAANNAAEVANTAAGSATTAAASANTAAGKAETAAGYAQTAADSASTAVGKAEQAATKADNAVIRAEEAITTITEKEGEMVTGASAEVDGTSGTPNVTVSVVDNKAHFSFTGIKGEKGDMGKYTVVSQTLEEVEIQPNVLNVWGDMERISVTFSEGEAGVANEYMMQFSCGDNPLTFTLPDGVSWMWDEEPEFESGYTYQVSVLNGLAVWAGFLKR